MDETKVIYHIDDEETPYLVKIPVSPQKVTLLDFKNVLNRPNYKFFFKSMDDDFGVVKEEIIEDTAHLPCFNGRVVSWLVSADGSNQSDGGGVNSGGPNNLVDSSAFTGGGSSVSQHAAESIFSTTDTESVVNSNIRRRHHHHRSHHQPHHHHVHNMKFAGGNTLLMPPGGGDHHIYNGCSDAASSSILASDLESTSFQSETTTDHQTECSSVSRLHVAKQRSQRRNRRKPHLPSMSRTSSYSSITDSTMSLNIITVSLNMDTVNFLGISIVGQSNKGGDGGIYVGSIMKGGAVALDGRIEPGDMILQVNDVNFENMSNDEAVRVLREVVQKPGPIKLVVAKCWDPNPKGYFTIPRTEPVRPIDPGAWVAHTAAVRGDSIPSPPPSSSTVSSSSVASTIPANEMRDCDNLTIGDLEESLTVHSPMSSVVQRMHQPDSGLEIRERMWLKITIPNAFIGTDLVDWLLSHVNGLQDRRDARKYATLLLKAGFIRHTVNKITFSEQCYYVFGDLCTAMNNLQLHGEQQAINHHHHQLLRPYSSSSETAADSASLLPSSNHVVPPPYMPYGSTAMEYMPMPFYAATSENTVYGYNRDESDNSGGSSNGGYLEQGLKVTTRRRDSSNSSVGTSDSDLTSLAVSTRCTLPLNAATTTTTTISSNSGGNNGNGGGAGGGSDGGRSSSNDTQVATTQGKEIAGSRQSFKIAMGNPCEMFVDVM